MTPKIPVALPLLPLSLAFLLNASARSAWAGQWVLDHYNREGVYVSQKIQLNSTFETPNTLNSKVEKTIVRVVEDANGVKYYVNGAEQPGYYYGGEGASLTWGIGRNFLDYFGNGNLPTYPGVSLRTGSGNLDISAEFRWQRNMIYDVQTYEASPDPTDNPPKYLWIVEEGIISGGESTNQWDGNWLPQYTTENPYPGKEFTFSNISHPFDVPYVAKPPTNPLYRGFDLRDRYIVPAEINGDTALGPVRHFTGQIDLNNYPSDNSNDRTASASLNFSYTAQPARLNILARLKSGHSFPALEDLDMSNLNQALSYLDDPSFQSSAQIAVGHKQTPSHEHEADLILQVLQPGGWGYYQGVYFGHMPYRPNIKIEHEEGVNKNVTILPSDAPGFAYTNGNGRIALATILSRDQGTGSGNMVNIHTDSLGSSANIEHVWDQYGEWFTGANGDAPMSPYVNFDQPTPFTFKPRFAVPITQHKLNFIVAQVHVAEWDEELNQSVMHVYTSDAANANPNSYPPVEYKSDLSEYATFSPDQSTDQGNGVYRASLTVPYHADKIVKDLSIAAEDDDNYEPQTQ